MPDNRPIRVIISGGGTGGHIYPALAVASALQANERRLPDGERPVPAEILYLHGPARIDAEVLAHSGLPHRRLDAGPLRGAAPHRLAANLARLVWATGQALVVMAAFRPHVVLATGGYVSAPAALAAAAQRVPLVLYLPDTSPGWAVRALAPLARRIALSFPHTKRYFKGGKAIVTGYPVRPEFLHANREAARRSFGLQEDLPVVMVMGGSSGAQSINRALAEVLEPLLHHAQVIHLCGELDEQALRAQRSRLEARLRTRYHLFRYLHRGIADAMAASDLVVSRAGASALAELPILRRPAILIPHPFGHQDDNAAFLVEQGAAVRLADHELEHGVLLPAILGLLENRPRLEQMAAAMGLLARPEAADNIASLVRSVARRKGR